MAERRGSSHRRRETQASNQSSRFGFSSESPSFSSYLLDAIYRSIDQGEEEGMMFYGEEKRAHQSCSSRGGRSDKEMANSRRGTRWMPEKKDCVDVAVSTKTATHLQLRKERENSCRGGAIGFSSAELESFRLPQRPKPVRTAIENSRNRRLDYGDELVTEARKREGKTKSGALKIYSELKKVKHPISPGGKLVGILNSIFAGHQKKHKIVDHPSPNSTCSSASSFSRSCLNSSSKTPSSAAVKKCVRFSPVSVIVDNKKACANAEITNNKIRRFEEAPKDVMGKYHHWDFNEEEDAASDASSDLFELENLSIQRCCEQLPVYETTSLHSNRAIAKGLLVL